MARERRRGFLGTSRVNDLRAASKYFARAEWRVPAGSTPPHLNPLLNEGKLAFRLVEKAGLLRRFFEDTMAEMESGVETPIKKNKGGNKKWDACGIFQVGEGHNQGRNFAGSQICTR